MELDSKKDVLDTKIIMKHTMLNHSHLIRRVDDKGQKYSFYQLLTRKQTYFLDQLPSDLTKGSSSNKTLGMFKSSNLFRLICTRIINSVTQKVITTVIISIFVFFSPFIDMNTLESRSTSLIRLSHRGILAILYLNHAWFMSRSICSSLRSSVVVAFGLTGSKKSLIARPVAMLDLGLAIMGLVKIDFMASLNIIRILRLIDFISKWHRLEHLREIVDLIKKSFTSIMWMLSILLLCTVFLGMFVNNLTVYCYH